MLLAVPYLYAAAICTTIINDGGPGWLYLLVLLFVWNAFKFLWIGPVSLVQLLLSPRLGRDAGPLTGSSRTIDAVGERTDVTDLPTSRIYRRHG